MCKHQQSMWEALCHAKDGIIFAFATERNMKIHAMATLIAMFMAWWLELDRYEVCVLLLMIAGVLVSEMFNISLEKLVDIASPEIHPLAKSAKDVAAGAVLWMACTSLVVGYLLFAGKVWR